MKKVKHEPQAIKEDPEKVARRERARRRREKQRLAEESAAREAAAHAKKGPKLVRAGKGIPGRSDPAPDVRASDVPVRKETRRRMKTVISQDNLLEMLVSPNPEDAKIQFCDEHYDRLMDKIKLHGIEHLINDNVEFLKAALADKRIDPAWHAQEALIRLAINTIGSLGVVQYRCPVCALNKFDYISQVALAMKHACVRKPS
jgi:hypothetical protein